MSDVAARLRALADAATLGPWRVVENDANPHLRNVLATNKAYGASGLLAPVVTPADARLIARAPELARGYADALDALWELDRDYHTRYVETGECLDGCAGCFARSALAPAARLFPEDAA